MARDPADLLAKLSGQPVRRYSTYEFGRMRDERCWSVIVPEKEAISLVYDLRKKLPSGFVAFLGTTDWLGDEKHEGGEVVVGRGEPPLDIVRIARTDACNYDLDTEDLIRKLESWHRSLRIDIFHAETATIELTLDKLPTDVRAFAEEVYEFCPDSVDQGIGSVEALAKVIEDYQQVYLWWD